MNRKRRIRVQNSWAGWGASALLHSGLLFAAALLFISQRPAGLPLEIVVGPAVERAELSPLEMPVARLEVSGSRARQAVESHAPALPELSIPSPFGPLTPSGGGRASAGSKPWRDGQDATTSATFFGTVANGDRFVYILDISPSMNQRRGQRLVRAVIELLSSIDRLGPEQSFYVLVFGWQTRRMFDDAARVPQAVPATLSNKRALRTWLAGLTTIGGTDPTEAIQIGLTVEPSAIFLLSDGEFNRPGGRRRAGEVIRAVMGAIRGREVPIPIYAITYEDRAGERAMTRIAAAAGGNNRFVRAPAGRSRSAPPSRLRYAVWPNYRRSVLDYAFREEERGGPVSGG